MNRPHSAAGASSTCPALFATRLFRPSLFLTALLAVLAVFTLAVHPGLAAPQLVPGAYGYGLDRAAHTAGFGTGSTIYVVSDFSDGPSAATTPGTLRHAVGQSGRRVIVFNRSGAINLSSHLEIENGDVTIAGQTAPAPGVALHGATLFVEANNVLIQHLRIRPGDTWSATPTHNRDAADITRGNGTIVSNVVFDHCTFMWSLDELVSSYWDYDNIAFNQCIFAEPLHRAIHVDEGTFPGHVPPAAQTLTRRAGSASTTLTTATGIAVGNNYELVNTTGVNQFIEYNLPVDPKNSVRQNCHIVVVGITGSNRGKFRVEVRNDAGTLLHPADATEFDLRVPSSTSIQNYVARAVDFDIPAVNPATQPTTNLRVKLIVTGTTGTGYALGVDQLSVTQGHGFGPLFLSGRTGGGHLSFTNNIFMNLWGRAPWVASKRVVIANNVLYNRGQVFMQLGHSSTPVAYDATIIGNSFIEGSAWQSWAYGNSPIKRELFPSGSKVYIASPANAYDSGGIASPPALLDTAIMRCETAIAALQSGPRPDIVLLDVGLPGIDGITGIRQLKQLAPDASLLVLTVFEDDEKIFRAICAGASGYLLKAEPTQNLLEAIDQAMTGGAPMNPRVARRVLEMFARASHTAADYNLNQREQAMLELMVQGCVRKQIADQLALNAHTVDYVMRCIYRKLHVNCAAAAVSIAVRERLVPPPRPRLAAR